MDISTILPSIRYFLIFSLLVSGILLWLQRHVDTKPRIYLMLFSFGSLLSCGYSLYLSYNTIPPSSFPVLPISSLNSGFGEILLLYLYPIEVVSPSWIRLRKVLSLFLPWMIIIAIQIIFPTDFIRLSSFSDIITHIGEFNVWFRLLILLACILPYTILILCIPHRWQENNVNKKWIYKYTMYIQGIGFLYCASMLTGSAAVKCVHLAYAGVIMLLITYQELFLRLFPTTSGNKIITAPPTITASKIQPEHKIEKQGVVYTHPLWKKLTTMMDEKELWREPDLTLGDLANKLFTNRTTLSTIIHQQGYSGYTEYINRRRIEAFIEKAKDNHPNNIQELFYDVGFRSKSTAIRNFRLYMNCTPSEYIQQKESKENTN